MAKEDIRLLEKLAVIQNKIKAKKSRYNKFGKYNYRSAEDILEAIKPFELEYRVTITISEELISDQVIKSIATITCWDTGESISTNAIVGIEKAGGMALPQAYGSGSSYGKKYALGNLLLIDDTADADAVNTHGKTAAKTKPILEGVALTKAKAAIKAGKFTVEDVKRKYDIPATTLKTLE